MQKWQGNWLYPVDWVQTAGRKWRTRGGSSAVGIELDASDLEGAEVITDDEVDHRPVTARTKQQLDEDETIARQMQIEMLYDLHGSSSKPANATGSNNTMLNPASTSSGSQSPPMVQGSANSLLPSGDATHDLSVTGRSAAAISSGSQSLAGAVPLGSQRLGLGNEYPIQSGVGGLVTSGAGTGAGQKQQMNALQRSAAGMEQLTGMGAGVGMRGASEHTEQSESLWDTENDKDHMTEGESSPSPEPPLAPNDLDALFSYISQFKPESIDLDPVLKPFLPDYIPAIGDLEAMIKIPAPGAPSAASTTTAPPPGTAAPAAEASTMTFFQDLGITILDEPAAKQSDPAVLHYQLKAMSKAFGPTSTGPSGDSRAKNNDLDTPGLVHAIHAHDPFAKKLGDWITSTNAPEWAANRAVGGYAPAAGKAKYPTTDKLMDVWDEAFAGAPTNPLDVLTSVDPRTGMGPLGSLDLPLSEAVKLACAVLGIPVHEAPGGKKGRGLIDALHCLFEVYAGFAESQHFSNELGQGASGSGIDMTGFPSGSGEFGMGTDNGGASNGVGGGQSAEWMG
ncbi:intraflagellar transport complex B protein 46 C terminal-domain-containing protein [Catenaria anguillulae PL171]|uniref:Intraflagellar transport complex B protein 46 C terminal-domain-containing protein n=1 Tax=Catenaria anguillulae PL171 TaxID=765915 RepID=A0A1Y2HLI9_9FUNG|nr:intraflagellar transport complex B protein 46 C terminal-domain-containing protein [Catenaria anguillulae PL171]